MAPPTVAEKEAMGKNIMKKLCGGLQTAGTVFLTDDQKKLVKIATSGDTERVREEQEYYYGEVSRLKKSYNQQKQSVENGPAKLKTEDIDYTKYQILGDPTITRTEVEDKIETLYNKINVRHIKTADEIYTHSIEQHDKNARDLETLLKYYKSAESYSNRMNNLLTMKQEENKKLELDLENILAGSTTNERKVVYEQHDLGNIHHTRKIMYYVYYLLFILYMVFGRFFSAEEYRRYSVWIGIILYVTLPFYITYVTDGLVYLYRKFIYVKDNKLSKNVYLDI
jgi:hypothetical protein